MKSEELITKLKNNEIPDGTKLEARGYNGNLVIDNYGHLRLDKEYYETLDGTRHPLSLYCVVDMLTNPNTDFKIVSGQVSNYYRLIDILNKIANGELKYNTKIIWDEREYTYKGDNEVYRKMGNIEIDLWNDMCMDDLESECELIEPNDSPDVGKKAECEHEWEEYGMYNTKTKEDKHFRKCIKCDLEEDIEPTDNTKIEELKGNEYSMIDIFYKLNEVIRHINK